MEEHKPVMLTETMQYLLTDKHGVYVDGTFGRGGHAHAVLNQLDDDAKLIAFDKDAQAIEAAKHNSAFNDPRFTLVHASFAELKTTLEKMSLNGKVQGILLDLGVSSPQLDQAERGFSFMRNGPLDMRMNQNTGVAATTWLATVDEKTLADVLKEYGEERFARRIARAIIHAREQNALTATGQLAEIVATASPQHEKGKHPATRTFQAIRIFINNELEELNDCLKQCLEALALGGRLVVISFHSLEDRIVKRFFNLHSKGSAVPRKLPLMEEDIPRRFKLLCRALKPSEMEIRGNSRARSAKLRIVEKIA